MMATNEEHKNQDSKESVEEDLNHTNIWVNRFFTRYFRKRAQDKDDQEKKWEDLDNEERLEVKLDTSLGFYEMDNLVHNLIH